MDKRRATNNYKNKGDNEKNRPYKMPLKKKESKKATQKEEE